MTCRPTCENAVDNKLLLSSVNFDLEKLCKENINQNTMAIFENLFTEKFDEIDIDKAILITNWNNQCREAEENVYLGNFKSYLLKFKGAGATKLPREPLTETLLTFFGAFVSILIFGLIDHYWLRPQGYIFAVAPFAAMATVMFYYHSYKHPVSQPRSSIFANIMGAIIAVAIRKCVGEEWLWIGCPLAVSITMAIMCLTNTVNPPAGATAMTVFYGGKLVADQQFLFVLIPAATGTILFVLLVLLINNLSPKRKYPNYWL